MLAIRSFMCASCFTWEGSRNLHIQWDCWDQFYRAIATYPLSRVISKLAGPFEIGIKSPTHGNLCREGLQNINALFKASSLANPIFSFLPWFQVSAASQPLAASNNPSRDDGHNWATIAQGNAKGLISRASPLYPVQLRWVANRLLINATVDADQCSHRCLCSTKRVKW
jgi:hypothetical protein